MVKRLINSYVKLLDEKLENWTLIVLIIALLIILVSMIINDLKLNGKNTIEIDWIKYEKINK